MEKKLSIYVHIPFCKQKCLYCDFLSAPASIQDQEVYIKALVREIEKEAPKYKNYIVDTIFFGGGTPSLLDPKQVSLLMKTLKGNYRVEKNAEITIECNPATADLEKLSYFRKKGINRISIGLQTADNKQLKCLGRIHSFEEFLDTYENARTAGFENINVDIMQAIPGQDIESCMDTVVKVVELGPEHISAYSLIVEEETPFFAMDLELPTEEEEREMYYATRRYLKNQGYGQYEISNYAKEGYACKHNIAYWTGKDYAGFGIGAASYVKGVRFTNISDREMYVKNLLEDKTVDEIRSEVHKLTKEEQMEEFMFLGLRMIRGVSEEDFKKRFGVTLKSKYEKVLEQHMKDYLISYQDKRYALTPRGIDVSNYVMADYLFD